MLDPPTALPPSDRPTELHRRWWALGLVWIVPGALQLIQEATYSRAAGLEGFSLWRAAPYYLPSWLPWVLFTLPVAATARRSRPSRVGWAASIGTHALLATVVATLHLTLVGWFRVQWPQDYWPEGWAAASFGAWLRQSFWSFQPQGELLAYAVVVATTLAVDHERSAQSTRARSLELEANLRRAELQALRTQLRPHFLFNALNSAIVLVHEDPDDAASMIHRLSGLLRSSLETDGRALLPLSEELRVLELYLGIEGVRFADRLAFDFVIEPRALDLEVPAWILQPIVENAIRHGIAPREEGGRLWVRAALDQDALVLNVEDDGHGFEDGGQGDRGSGLGLENTRARLAALSPAATLQVGERPGGGARVELRIPIAQGPGAASQAARPDGPPTDSSR